jgi:hypothetical protein
MKWLWGVIVAMVLGAVFAILYCRNPFQQTKKELEVIEAARAAKQDVIEKGAVIARRKIEADHAKTIKKFDGEQARKLKRLRRDPVALARWLTRVSG